MKKTHPSTELAQSLLLNSNEIIKGLLIDPKSTFKLLKSEYLFGLDDELWDDFIFTNVIAPGLHRVSDIENLEHCTSIYSTIDELLFLPYIRRNEEPIRFRRCFWLVNSIGLKIAKRIQSSEATIKTKDVAVNANRNHLVFILKGPYKLAHTEFLTAYFLGTEEMGNIQCVLVLIDDTGTNIPIVLKKLENLTIISLATQKLTVLQKIYAVHTIVKQTKALNTIWVACVQNISLYLGSGIPSTRLTYWSMKYHSIIMPQLTHYAGLGFGGKPFSYDGVDWYRGRAFPYLEEPVSYSTKREKHRKKYNIRENDILGGCFVRAEKILDISFWEVVRTLLREHKNLHFVLASQYLPPNAQIVTQDEMINKRFKYAGWVDTKALSCALDIYLDSFPRGSCNTIFESCLANVPFIIYNSPHNRESSALPYFSAQQKDFPGIVNSKSEYVKLSGSMIKSSELRYKIASKQNKLMSMMQGLHSQFSKDYSEYFLK